MNFEKYELMKLSYSVDALEPYISGETVDIHYNGHHRNYVNNLNKVLECKPQFYNLSLECLIMKASVMHGCNVTKILNNAGGVLNHNIYWRSMSDIHDQLPIGKLKKYINAQYGSVEKLMSSFITEAGSFFGSGYTWLVTNSYGCIKIVCTKNQDTLVNSGWCPLLNVDLWEHAYYLDYQNKRKEYLDNWLHIVNWQYAEEKFISVVRMLGNNEKSKG